MQKKIIVLALAAAFSAPAFAADTTVYGVVDAAIANISASGTKSDMSAHSGGLGGSRLGVKSSEDLGDGLKASINLEYGLDAVTGTALGAARQTLVSVEGGFGKVAAGYLQTTGYDFSRFDPTSGSLVSPLHNITGKSFMIGNNGSLKRIPRALGYTSPVMGGFTVAANYSTAADTTTNLGVADTSAQAKSTAYLVSANYVAGPLAAAIVHANKTATTTQSGAVPPVVAGGAKTTETAIGASYDLGMAKLFATYQTNKVDTANDSDTVMSVSAAAPFGASTIVLTYAKATMTAAGAAAFAATPADGSDANVSGYSLVYLNSLSKTATFYASYNAMSQGSATRAYSVANNAIGGDADLVKGTGSSMIAAGLSKKF